MATQPESQTPAPAPAAALAALLGPDAAALLSRCACDALLAALAAAHPEPLGADGNGRSPSLDAA